MHTQDSEDSLPKIGKPATRALAAVGITRLSQVARKSRAELAALHGVGPKALRILEEALAARGQSLAPSKK
jgi:predicted flap endonuclease-1-like 5' DNA nuclease